MALAKTTGQITDTTPKVQAAFEYQKKARGLKKEMFDPRYLGLDLMGFMAAPVGGIVSNILRSEARRQIIQGMTKRGVGGTLRQYTGANPLKRYYQSNVRSNTKTLLRQANKLPQEMLDPIETLTMRELKGSTLAQIIDGKHIQIDPKKWQWIGGRQSLTHEVHHGYTRGSKLGSRSAKDIQQFYKSKLLENEVLQHHGAGTYNKKYGKIGFERAAEDFERRTKNFTSKTPRSEWRQAYDKSLDVGMKFARKNPQATRLHESAKQRAHKAAIQFKESGLTNVDW